MNTECNRNQLPWKFHSENHVTLSGLKCRNESENNRERRKIEEKRVNERKNGKNSSKCIRIPLGEMKNYVELQIRSTFFLVSFVSFSLRFRCYFSLFVFRFLLCIRGLSVVHGKIDAVKVKLQKKHMEKRHDDMKIFGFICKQLLILISAGNINSFYSVLNEHLFKRKRKNFEPVFT